MVYRKQIGQPFLSSAAPLFLVVLGWSAHDGMPPLYVAVVSPPTPQGAHVVSLAGLYGASIYFLSAFRDLGWGVPGTASVGNRITPLASARTQ